MDIAISIDGVPIRLTIERWTHITGPRDDLIGRIDDVLAAIERPDWITRGYRGAKVAWKGAGRRRYLVVVYREVSDDDGFVITAFYATKARKTNKLWP